jgi:hypothetical protein
MGVDLDFAAPARDVLSVRRETIDDGRAARVGRYLRALLAAVFVYPELPGAAGSGPAVPAYLVVECINTGDEVLRLRSDLQDVALLQHVLGHVETLTVGEFCDQWGVDRHLAAPAT